MISSWKLGKRWYNWTYLILEDGDFQLQETNEYKFWKLRFVSLCLFTLELGVNDFC